MDECTLYGALWFMAATEHRPSVQWELRGDDALQYPVLCDKYLP